MRTSNWADFSLIHLIFYLKFIERFESSVRDLGVAPHLPNVLIGVTLNQ